MRVEPTDLPGVLLLEPTVFGDDRGFFYESWNAKRFAEATGISTQFVQDNHSRSVRGVLRGIHYQTHRPQAKLVRTVTGAILDVAVDLRRSSPHFLEWVAVELTAENRWQLWVPEGFGHGFVVLSDVAEVLYKTTEFYLPEFDRAVRYDDPQIGVAWPDLDLIVSDKDRRAPLVADAALFD